MRRKASDSGIGKPSAIEKMRPERGPVVISPGEEYRKAARRQAGVEGPILSQSTEGDVLTWFLTRELFDEGRQSQRRNHETMEEKKNP
jgi:hypothetical protein